MIHPALTLGSLVAYLLLLLGLGAFADRKLKTGQSFFNNPIFYALSLAVYCTTWTFYGSIGNASTNGLLFSTIYLGPTLGAILWWPILRKLIRIKNRFHITSIVDFISARYNKSLLLGVVLTCFLVIGFIPYNALQLKSIMWTTGIMLTPTAGMTDYIMYVEVGILTAIILFTIFFGLRRLDPTERHPGMITALTIESIAKLLATIAGGIFIVYFLSDGVKNLIEAIPSVVQDLPFPHMGTTNFTITFEWISWLILASCAVIFLPRQFHVAIIENGNENHVKTAQWAFPLYLLITNLFVLPIAIYGMKNGVTGSHAESMLLELPLQQNQNILALLIYLGGFSAGIGMLTVSLMTVSTMITNHLLMPIASTWPKLNFLRRHVLKSRWIAATIIMVMAYLYQKYLATEGAALVSMGMISFVAAFQFAPPILFGLYWSKANLKGALIGSVLGWSTWAYTLFIPAFIKSGLIENNWLKEGPFAISWLNPESLFGVTGLTPISHAFVWTAFLNCSGIILGSLIFKTSAQEKMHADDFTSDQVAATSRVKYLLENADISVKEKTMLIRELLSPYFSAKVADRMLDLCLREAHVVGEFISISQLADLNFAVERTLAGAIGSAAAHHAIRQANIITQDEEAQLSKMFAQMLSHLHVSPAEFKKRVDFQIEKATLLKRQKDELEKILAVRMREVQKMQEQLVQSSKMSALGEMAGGVAHEINSPLAIIQITLEQMQIKLNADKLDKNWAIGAVERLVRVTWRIAGIIKGLRTFSSSDDKLPFETKKLSEIIDETLAFCQEKFRNQSIDLKVSVEPELSLECRSVQLSQVILNILSNGFDAIIDREEKWMRVDAKKAAEMVEISITDSGHGIPAEVAEKIMQPFFTTKKIGKGTGLGLSISRGIIEDHGGQLILDHTCANTRFVIRLPLSQQQYKSA